MSDTLKTILEKYKARSGDEENFIGKHTDNVEITDAPGAKEIDSAAKKAKQSNRKKDRQGYNADEDEEVYEEMDYYSLEDIKTVLESYEVDPELIEEVEDSLRETSSSYFMKVIDEAVKEFYEEANQEEREILDEMLSSPSGYSDFVDYLFEDKDEEDDEDEDDDEDDDEDEDNEVEVNPKMKKG